MDLVRSLGGAAAPAVRVFAELERRYAEPQRHYHTLEHVEHVLDVLDLLDGDEAADPHPGRAVDPASAGRTWGLGAAVDPGVRRLAAWWHDAVYDPTRADNEEASARLVEEHGADLGVSDAVQAETCRLIRLTAGHQVDPADETGARFVDADLAILGADAAGYDRYARGVRAEYGALDDATFRAGRAAFLDGLLTRPRLFHTAVAHARFDAAARANLARERAGLEP